MEELAGESRKHHAKWFPRQARIDDLMTRVHSGKAWTTGEATRRVQSSLLDSMRARRYCSTIVR
jgi:hypothetical protein